MTSRTIKNEKLTENIIQMINDCRSYKYKTSLPKSDKDEINYLKIIVSKDIENNSYNLKIEKKNSVKDTLIQWEIKINSDKDCTLEYTNFKDKDRDDIFASMNENTFRDYIYNVSVYIKNIIDEVDRDKEVSFLEEMMIS